MNFEQTDKILKQLDELLSSIKSTESIHAEYVLSINKDDTKLNISIDSVNNQIKTITMLLKEIKPESINKSSTESKILHNLYGMLITKFAKIITIWKNNQQHYKDIELKRIRHEIRIRFPTVTEDEINIILKKTL